MKFRICWYGRDPVGLSERAAALLRILYDVMERVEPVTDFRFELAGISCTAEYEYLYEEATAPPEKYVCVRMAFIAPNCGMTGQPFIDEDGRLGVEYEIDEDQEADILLDSDAISWRT